MALSITPMDSPEIMTIQELGTIPEDESGTGDRRRWVALVVVCLAMFMNALDGSIVNVALPDIQKSLGFNQSGLTWVVDAYLISFGSFLLLAGRLGDLVGRKKVFLAGVALFVLASIACGSADGQTMLIVARFIQGIGGALSSSVIVAIIVTEFPSPLEHGKAMSAYVFVAVGGGSVGLLAGGVLTQFLSWHWIFFVNVPIGIATLILGRFLIVENIGLGIKQGVDWVGSGAHHPLGDGRHLRGGHGDDLRLALGAHAGDPRRGHRALRVLHRARVAPGQSDHAVADSEAAHVDRRRRHPRPAHHGHVLDLLHRALYFEHVLGYSPVRTGLAFLPQALCMAALSTGVTAKLVDRFGANRDVPGHGHGGGRVAPVRRRRRARQLLPPDLHRLLVAGPGAGLSFMPLLQIGMSEVPGEDAGLGSGVVNVSQQMAGAIGLAFLSTIAANRTKSLVASGHAVLHSLTLGYQLALYIAAGCVLLGLLVSPLLLRTDESPEERKKHIEENMRNPETKEHLVL